MKELISYLRPELVILIPVLYLLGEGLKKTNLNNKFIPLLLGGAGILCSLFSCIAADPAGCLAQPTGCLFTAVTQGILSAGASVYCHQIIKQSKKED